MQIVFPVCFGVAEMKILTWNINGIRANRKSLKILFDSLDADVICLQETKVTRDMLDEPSAIVEGYNSYFSFSRKRSGYSGVATFCKDSVTPVKAEEGLSGFLTNQSLEDIVGCYGYIEDFDADNKELDNLDAEGRAVITQHQIRNKDGDIENLSIINVYVPRAAEREDRQQYKLRFLSLLQNRAESLVDNKHHVIVLGDINTTHRPLDNCDTESEEFTKRPSRLWLNQFLREEDRDPTLECDLEEGQILGESMTPHLTGGLFVDSYRVLNPNKEGAFTNWCTTTNARKNNYGRRLDYILTSEQFHENYVKEGIIMPEVDGSDHCPVKVIFDCESVVPKKCPSLCTKHMPEFKGSQQKLSSFFVKKSNRNLKIFPEISDDKSEKKNLLSPKKEAQISPSLKKRASESQITNSQSKRLKSEVSKQSSLKYFFSQPAKEIHSSLPKAIDFKMSKIVPKEPNVNISEVYVTKKQKLSEESSENDAKSKSSISEWKTLLSGPGKIPLCKGHKEPCVLRTVKKDGPNKNKQFYVCARGEGHSSNPEARCEHFVWINHKAK